MKTSNTHLKTALVNSCFCDSVTKLDGNPSTCITFCKHREIESSIQFCNAFSASVNGLNPRDISYRIYSIKRRPRLNAADGSKITNKRRPRINAAPNQKNAAFVRGL